MISLLYLTTFYRIASNKTQPYITTHDTTKTHNTSFVNMNISL